MEIFKSIPSGVYSKMLRKADCSNIYFMFTSEGEKHISHSFYDCVNNIWFCMYKLNDFYVISTFDSVNALIQNEISEILNEKIDRNIIHKYDNDDDFYNLDILKVECYIEKIILKKLIDF
jgi:hypothetical protein